MKPAGEFGTCRVPVEVVEPRRRLLLGPAVEPQREAGVDIEGAAPGLRMADDDRVHRVLGRQLGVADAAGEIPLMRAPVIAEDVAARMTSGEPFEGRL